MNKVIAVDIDDTLNNFTETLEKLKVDHNDYQWLYKNEQEFNPVLSKIQSQVITKEDYVNPDFAHLYNLIHREVYEKAEARTDAIKFMQWLKENNWKIIILTYRDLRNALDVTKGWLKDNNIPYDYLFSANNKTVFCGIWKIKYLIDDDPLNIICAWHQGINMYYPITKKNNELIPDGIGKSIGFNNFDELYEVIA